MEKEQRQSDFECVLQESASNHVGSNNHSIQDKMNSYSRMRENRLQQFFNHVQQKRDIYIQNLLEKYQDSTPVCS